MRKLISILSLLFVVFTTNGQELSDKFCEKLRNKMVKSTPSIEWVQFGPGMSGNNKTAFAHPTNPNIFFIAPNMGNAYRTTNQGHTYETILNCDQAGFLSGLRGPKGLNCIDFSRQDPNFGFCLDEKNRGIFITHDCGKTWKNHTPALKVFNNIFLSSLAVDPKDDSVWYVGCGRIKEIGKILFTQKKPHGTYTDPKSKGLIWKSSDKGDSWKVVNTGIDSNAEIETILVDPKNSNIVYASTTYGFYKSLDGAKSWIPHNKGLDTPVLRSFTHHYDKKRDRLSLYVIANVMWKAKGETIADSVGGIFRSNNRGESWEKINGDIALDMSYFQKDYSIKKSYSTAASFFFGMKSKEFLKKHPRLPKSITQRFNQISVDPNDSNNIYVVNTYSNASRNNFAPGQLWRTENGGKHWYVTFRNGTGWQNDKDGDYWKDRGNPIGSNVSIKYLNHWMARSSYDSKSCNMTMFSCDGKVLHTQMAKISLMSYDKGMSWVDIDDEVVENREECYIGAGNSNLPGHGFYQDPRLKGKVFCCGGENSLWITAQGGDKVRKGAQAATPHKFSPQEQSLSCYAIHPHDTLIHFALFFRQHNMGDLLRSTDGGKSWNVFSKAIQKWEQEAHSGDQSVHQLCLTIDKDNPKNFYFCVPRKARTLEYVGDSKIAFGVHKSSDGGKSWHTSNLGLPKSLDVSSITLDPNDQSKLYATVHGKNGGLFVSTRGEKWSKVKSTIKISKDQGINDLHFSLDGKIYITSGSKNGEKENGGLWCSSDNMETWTRLFNFPFCFRVETANYNPDIIMLSTLSNNKINYLNPGTYLSKDGGKRWIKFNKGNGQSDRINDIAIDQTTKGKYYLSTFGSGWYVAVEK